jgi:iduronate 2-sulfatase
MRSTLQDGLRTLVACAFIHSFGAAAQVSAPDARPNILWIVSEDNAAFTVGAYGDPLARTPNIDQLAANGVLFRRAYAAARRSLSAPESIKRN